MQRRMILLTSPVDHVIVSAGGSGRFLAEMGLLIFCSFPEIFLRSFYVYLSLFGRLLAEVLFAYLPSQSPPELFWRMDVERAVSLDKQSARLGLEQFWGFRTRGFSSCSYVWFARGIFWAISEAKGN